MGLEYKMDVLLKILGFISIQVENFKKIINQQNFDDVHDLESIFVKQEDLNLAETIEAYDEQRILTMLNGLKAED